MKKFITFIIMSLVFLSCSETKVQNDFINQDCNIPIIECVLDKDTVHLIVDTGAEYSLIDQSYYQNNSNNFKLVNQIETQFSGIGGVSTQMSDIVGTYTSLGYITFVEQNLSAVTQSLSQYNVVGLIGSDFLKSHNFIVDYKMRKIYPYEQLDSIYGKSCN